VPADAPHLTSTSSDRVKAVRALHSRSGRRKAGRFVVEGPQAVSSALDAGVPVHELFVDEHARIAFSDLVDRAAGTGARIVTAEPHVMVAMGETEHPQGVLAVCALLPGASLDEILGAPAPVLILDRVADPGNVGTILRTAEAVGVAGVLLTPECADVHGGKVVRATTGSLFRVPVLADIPMAEIIAGVRAHGRPLAVATGDGGESLFDAVDSGVVSPLTCFVIGSEAHGVGEEARAAADVCVRIPMVASVESLNAAVSAAVILYVLAHGARSGAFGDAGFR
jgi:TrmH family RNA methyltransferase